MHLEDQELLARPPYLGLIIVFAVIFIIFFFMGQGHLVIPIFFTLTLLLVLYLSYGIHFVTITGNSKQIKFSYPFNPFIRSYYYNLSDIKTVHVIITGNSRYIYRFTTETEIDDIHLDWQNCKKLESFFEKNKVKFYNKYIKV